MSRPVANRSETLPLSVVNTGFLLDRLGEDCHPLQFLRELTQNSIDAILRTNTSGEIVWDVDWNNLELDGKYKLAIIDTGIGMTGHEMVKYINNLSSSISEQSMGGNFGVGAKIAAATKNHAGLIYLSWKDGKGSMIHLWRDPNNGQYGLRKFHRPDGSFEHFAEVENDVKPTPITNHGTMVVLLGSDSESNTMLAPEGASVPSRWIAKYLNSRYYKFPDSVTVKAREGWNVPRSDADRNRLRVVTGQAIYLEKHCIANGCVQLKDAKAHWWILKHDESLSQNSGYIESSGHVAALFNNELYEMSISRSGTAKLQQFGVILGHRQVVIYVEPEPGMGTVVMPNTSRTTLLINNEPLPWSDWAAEFREKMPEAIEKLIHDVAAGTTSSDHSKSIRERLRQIWDLYKVSRYKPTPSGEVSIEEPSQGGNSVGTTKGKFDSGSSGSSTSKSGQAGGIYSVFLKKNGTPGTETTPDIYPQVLWVSVKDGSRTPGDIEDRAAKYLLDQNVLQINGDFRVINDMINHRKKEYEDKAAVGEIVTDVVHQWFEQALIETIIGIQGLRSAKEWPRDAIEKATSEEALTAAVMARYHINANVKRELGAKLGKVSNHIV